MVKDPKFIISHNLRVIFQNIMLAMSLHEAFFSLKSGALVAILYKRW